MSIQEHLNKIRNAIYGREVRESIAKGIETAYDDASEKDNANMEVKIARGTHPNLRSRLEEVDNKQQQTTAQLAQTEQEAMRKRELEDLSPTVIAAIEGGEGTEFNLLSIPQDKSVTPEKTTFIKQSSNMFNKDTIIEGKVIGWDGNISDNIDYGYSDYIVVKPNQIYSTFGVYHIAWYDSSFNFIKRDAADNHSNDRFTAPNTAYYVRLNINPNHLAYSKELVQMNEGNVLLDYEPYYNRLVGVEVGPEDIPDNVISLNHLDFIKSSTNLIDIDNIETGKLIGGDGVKTDNIDYAISPAIDVSNVRNIYVKGVMHVSFYDKNDTFIFRRSPTLHWDVGIAEGPIAVPENATIARPQFLLTGDYYTRGTIQLNRGTELLPFEPFYKNKISPEIDLGFQLSGEGSLENKVLFFGATNVLIDFHSDPEKIEIPSGATYMYENVRYYAPKLTVNFGGGFNFLVFNVSNKTFKVVAGTPALNDLSEDDIVILVIDTTKQKVFGEIGQLEIIDTNKTAQTLHKGISFTTEEVPETFNAPTDGLQTDGTGPEGFESGVTQTNEIYALFDNLVAEHPDVLKKYTKGKDSSGLIDFNYYVFKPENITQVPEGISSQPTMSKKLPKLILEAGIHGPEQIPVYCLYWLLNGVLNDWKNDEVYEYFRFNTELVIIPVVNPWGFDNYSRINFNGVDLNRNFDNRWEFINSAEGTATYKGPTPFSEPESQYIRDIIIEHQDALWFADYHNNDGQTDPANWNRLVWLLYSRSVTQMSTATTLNKISRKYKKQDENVPENVPYLGYMSRNDLYPHAYAYAFKKHNILASIPELFYSAPNAEKDSHKVNAMNYELFVQVALDVLIYTKDKVQ